MTLPCLGTLQTPAALVARAERRARPCRTRDRGSAIPEFVMVAALLLNRFSVICPFAIFLMISND